MLSMPQEIWEVAVAALSRSPSTSEVTLAGVRLLKRCLEFPSPAVSLSTATRVLHHLTLSSSSEVREGTSVCALTGVHSALSVSECE